MYDFLVDLYAYRERAGKGNLENWLTEALAATIRCLSSKQMAEFRAYLSDGTVALDSNSWTVSTQMVADPYGIPDLVLFESDKPIVLFENKVAHSVAEGIDDLGTSQNQLQRYAKWLNESGHGSHPETQLVFLTHLTRPPPDFATRPVSNCPYFGVRRRVLSWGEVGRVLLRITESEGEPSLARGLAGAFYKMLESRDMANEFPDSRAFAATELFLALGRTLENLVTRMWARISKTANCSNMSREVIGPELEYARYTAWRYVNRGSRIPSTDTYIQTGIWFPDVGHIWDADDLDGYHASGPQAFLIFANDNDQIFSSIEGRPTPHWHRPDSDFLVLRALHEFQGTPDERAAGILDWLGSESSNLRKFLLLEELTT